MDIIVPLHTKTEHQNIMNNVVSSKTVKNNFFLPSWQNIFNFIWPLSDYKSFFRTKQIGMHALKGVLKG